MTELRKNLIKLFKTLSIIELHKERYYPSKAFQSVSNALELSDHYSINNNRVTISNKTTGFIKILGESSSNIFIEYLNTGSCSRLNGEPYLISDLENITGIGEVKKNILITAGIRNSSDLLKLNLNVGDVIPGTNLRYTNQIHTGLILWNRTHGVRISRELASKYISDFKKLVCKKIYVLGSYRRKKSTVGDIDIVIVKSKTDYSKKIISWLDEILVQGDTKIAGIKGQTQVDIRLIDKQYLGAHILHGTGSQEFNIKLRAYAKSLGMKLNEYGILDNKGKFNTFRNELEVFKFLGLDYVPPEMR